MFLWISEKYGIVVISACESYSSVDLVAAGIVISITCRNNWNSGIVVATPLLYLKARSDGSSKDSLTSACLYVECAGGVSLWTLNDLKLQCE